jgi:hypothetical protein
MPHFPLNMPIYANRFRLSEGLQHWEETPGSHQTGNVNYTFQIQPWHPQKLNVTLGQLKIVTCRAGPKFAKSVPRDQKTPPNIAMAKDQNMKAAILAMIEGHNSVEMKQI